VRGDVDAIHQRNELILRAGVTHGRQRALRRRRPRAEPYGTGGVNPRRTTSMVRILAMARGADQAAVSSRAEID
jgi:hypothetical protein